MTPQEMGDKLGIRVCGGLLPTGHYCHRDHFPGSAETGKNLIHFSDRRMTRLETFAFFRLASHLLHPDLSLDPPWRRVYRQNMLFRDMARQIGITNPANPASLDRAFVLASVAGMSNEVPLRKQAYDWARRGPRREQA